MNLLIDPLPQAVEVGGVLWGINSAFFIMVQFELLMQDEGMPEEEKVLRALGLFYPQIPPDLPEAVKKLLWFYRCGAEEKTTGHGLEGSTPRAYCFEEDAARIFSAFYTCYQIDLNTVEDLHWWKFRTLLNGLPEDCEFSRVVGYRTADLSGFPKEQKKFYQKMRERYALGRGKAVGISQLEREQRMLDYAARRSAEAAKMGV